MCACMCVCVYHMGFRVYIVIYLHTYINMHTDTCMNIYTVIFFFQHIPLNHMNIYAQHRERESDRANGGRRESGSLILLYMRPHTTIYVLILLYMCPCTFMYVC